MERKSIPAGLATWLVLFLAFVLGVQAYAQTAGGTILGTMTDPSGAVIPAGVVAIKNMATNVTRTVTTNERGFYSAPSLLPGTYRITATAAGFRTRILSDVLLTVGAEQVVNAQMTVGEVSQQVEVSGGAVAVDLASSTLSHVVNAGQIVEMPLNGRDWTLLATFQPGVATVAVQNTSDQSRNQRGNGIQMTISGGRPTENNYRLNGISLNDHANSAPGNVMGSNLGVDSIQEFSVLTSTYSAEYGRTTGGVINAVVRSGTNALHGTAYYFHRNSALDARNFFDQAGVPPFRRHQFGSSVGGPIRKDRTFFFANYDGGREFLALTTVSDVPSPAAREGRLSSGPITVAPSVRPFLAVYPLPNGPLSANGDTGKLFVVGGRVSRADYVIGKIDHRFSDKDSLSGTYFLDIGHLDVPDEFNNKSISQRSRRQLISLEEVHIFSPRLVNTLRLGVSRPNSRSGLSQDVANPLLKDPSLNFIPGRFIGEIQTASLSDFSGGQDSYESNLFRFTSYQIYDNLFLTKGIHSLKFGANVERIHHNEDVPNLPGGRFVFNSLRDFLTSRPSSFAGLMPGSNTIFGIRQTIFGAYIQDDVRWRSNLTVNLGLRYEMSTVPSEVNGRVANLTSPFAANVKEGFLFNNPTLVNFAPRVGFSWDPFGDGRTAVRGGFGMFDSLPLYQIFVNRFSRTPPFFRQANATLQFDVPGAFPRGSFNNLTAAALRTIYVENDPSRAYKLQWNLNVQRQLLRDLAMEIGYVGARGVHIATGNDSISLRDPIQTSPFYLFGTAASTPSVNPNFGRIASTVWASDTHYHALQTTITKRLSHGVQIQGSYTWAKSIDSGSNTFSSNEYLSTVQNPWWRDTSLQRGLSEFDIRHNFVLNFQWELPSPKSWAGPAKWLVGGWQVGGIYQARTGLPFTAAAGLPSAFNNTITGQRPDFVNGPGCDNPTNPGNPNNYLKLQCFSFPAPGAGNTIRIGNLGRNTLTGPGLSNFDFSVFKNHPIRESFKVQFRAEFFNLLNRTNFQPMNSIQWSIFDSQGRLTGSAGQLNKAFKERVIQFGLKLVW